MGLNEAVSYSDSRPGWRWLRLHAWALVGLVALGGATGGLVALQAPPSYESEYVVVASSTTISTEDFGSLAEAVFGTDTVLQPVVDRLGLEETSQSLLASGRLAMEPVAGAAAVRIKGRASTPGLAADLAESAATSFSEAAETRGMGTFQLFATTGPAGRLRRVPAGTWALAGAFLAGVAGLALALVVYFARRPVVTEESAQRLFPSDLSIAVHVLRLWEGPRGIIGRLFRRRPVRWVVHPAGVIPALWRAVRDRGGTGSSDPVPQPSAAGAASGLVVERRRSGDLWADAVADILLTAPGAFFLGPGSVSVFRSSEIDVAEDEVARSLDAAETAIVILSEGAPRDRVQEVDEAVRAAGARYRVLVYVRAGWKWGRRGPAEDAGRLEATPPAPEPPEDSVALLSRGLAALAGDVDESAGEGHVRPLLELLRSSPSAVLDTLAEGLDDPQPMVRGVAVALLRSVDHERAYELLLHALSDDSPEVRISAALALATSSPRLVCPFLVRSLEDPPTRQAAARVLAAMGERAGPVLLESLAVAGEEGRRVIRGLLGSAGSHPAPEPAGAPADSPHDSGGRPSTGIVGRIRRGRR